VHNQPSILIALTHIIPFLPDIYKNFFVAWPLDFRASQQKTGGGLMSIACFAVLKESAEKGYPK